MKEAILAANHAEYRATDLGVLVPPECDLIHEYLFDIQHAGNQVLEIGPGNGRAVAYLLQAGFDVDIIEHRSEVIDPLLANLSRANIDSSRLTIQKTDIADFQLPLGKYSFISISHVLHFFDLRDALAILHRLIDALAPKGLVLVRVHSVDNPSAASPGDYVKHFFTLSNFNEFNIPGLTWIHRAHVKARNSRRSAITRTKAEGVGRDEATIEWYIGHDHAHLELILRRD